MIPLGIALCIDGDSHLSGTGFFAFSYVVDLIDVFFNLPSMVGTGHRVLASLQAAYTLCLTRVLSENTRKASTSYPGLPLPTPLPLFPYSIYILLLLLL